MKYFYFSLAICGFFLSCNNPNATQAIKDNKATAASESQELTDNRPKEQLNFLNRVKGESDYDVTSNAAKKDEHIQGFNKYAKDSLKKITDWELMVTDVNDNKVAANSFGKAMFDMDNNEIYNLVLVAPIKIDKTVDTIAIDNRVDFTYTIPKTPKGNELKQELAVIKTLKKGDTVIVSGALTHIDESLKINFASFYDSYGPWNVDLLATSIRKKK